MNLPNLKEAKKRTKYNPKIINYKLNKKYENIGTNKTYFIKTYGCQMNEHDSENIKALLEQLNFKETIDMEKADLILLNTCAIRENAHNKVFGMLGRIKHLKEQNKNIIVGICGCMVQEEKIAKELNNKYKWVDLVFGTHNINTLPDILYEALNKHKQQLEVFSIEGDIIENMPAKRDSKYKAWVNIMYGCDKFCTYCIVPYTRGKQRSRNKENIIEEIKDLKAKGYKEITLLGQNVNAYGKDLKANYDMADLLEETAKTSIERVRFITSHPWDFTDKMIEVIKKYPNIMPYIHLPIQSGSNRILKLMGRRYTRQSYLELWRKLKQIPNVAITTDIIVGFPGETEEDFEETLDIVNTCKYDSAFTFIFSPREGTPAAKMQDNIPLKAKEQRLYKLNDLVNKYAKENNDKYLGKTVSVLLETTSEKNKNMLMGYTETMKLVNVKAQKKYLGQIVKVKITDVKTWSLDGEIIE